jgi:hypothetical protein
LKAADLTDKEFQMANSKWQNSNGFALAICSLPFAI